MSAPNEEGPWLHARDVSITYGGGDVVHQAEIVLSPGRVTALVGPNGSGKSTLLRGIARLQRLRTGAVALRDGRDAGDLDARSFAREVAMLSQSRPTPVGVTVRDAVEFGRHPHRSRWRGHDPQGAERVEHALRLTRLTDRASDMIDELSGGQLQRVWIASALAQDTDVLLLDEPTNHLDLRYQVEVLELVRELADDHGIAVGAVLHDLNQAAALADRVVVLSRGRVVADGEPARAMRSELLSEVFEIDVVVDHDTDDRVPRVHVPRQLLRRRAATANA
ncbi:iron complex transport system ATP-binding protein [Isoptericola sp. CG 20/1183]|uniref:Iron complex transport system ATP-binding protein n=1 Tax=Isoptericola halotolerans TaxID=300560 RepID=A0ABX5EA16_9MICO|nr:MULTISPECIES: ABC transporter ATP-binding protein [Isoptericola]MCK0118566.1 ABC transporter ATP-binding protein [Isoptericola sp. S6320L]PRZ03228.1 iron complex transport system ATP-binding protein [Isoptericola sp. CG 20/1183]PRZ03560.1 iron complex transport system ATP-binding protein [Isoptericola halotolerans]